MPPSRYVDLFPEAIRVGRTFYVGSQIARPDGDIEQQTAAVFERLVDRLQTAGARMSDLINLRTHYVFAEPDGAAVTDYWNRMTRVRLKFLADPGPAATALRVSGVAGPQGLIGVDGVASIDPDRQRIMPEHAWDWTIPTPLSQGWRVGGKIYVGGQISADRSGKALCRGDIIGQARNALEYIRHVLGDGDMDWSDIVAIRLCFKPDVSAAVTQARLEAVSHAVREVCAQRLPTITALGVDLLYEGLLLEIDAIAARGDRVSVTPAGAADWVAFAGFPAACRCGAELHIGGISAPGGAALQAQVEASFGRLIEVLASGGFEPGELVKLTLYCLSEGGPDGVQADRAMIMDVARRYLPTPRPVLTLLSVPALPQPGQRFQLDGVAVHESDRTEIVDPDGASA